MYVNIEWASAPVQHLFDTLDIALARAFMLLTNEALDFSREESVHVYFFGELEKDAEAYTITPDEDGVIEVEVYGNAKDKELALAHELVHVAQILAGLPLDEVQAYALEEEIKKCLVS